MRVTHGQMGFRTDLPTSTKITSHRPEVKSMPRLVRKYTNGCGFNVLICSVVCLNIARMASVCKVFVLLLQAVLLPVISIVPVIFQPVLALIPSAILLVALPLSLLYFRRLSCPIVDALPRMPSPRLFPPSVPSCILHLVPPDHPFSRLRARNRSPRHITRYDYLRMSLITYLYIATLLPVACLFPTRWIVDFGHMSSFMSLMAE